MGVKKSEGRRDWCFTLNNYTDSDKEILHASGAKYIFYGHEKCPTTGTPHLQGYIYFKDAVSFKTIKRHLPRANIRPCDGTTAQNQRYCGKDGVDLFEQGVAPK
ncbi:replication protein, partial [uncultured marine virus]